LRTPSVRRRPVAFRFGAIFDWGFIDDEMLTNTKNKTFIFIINNNVLLLLTDQRTKSGQLQKHNNCGSQ
jgi:hypothetical protein